MTLNRTILEITTYHTDHNIHIMTTLFIYNNGKHRMETLDEEEAAIWQKLMKLCDVKCELLHYGNRVLTRRYDHIDFGGSWQLGED